MDPIKMMLLELERLVMVQKVKSSLLVIYVLFQTNFWAWNRMKMATNFLKKKKNETFSYHVIGVW